MNAKRFCYIIYNEVKRNNHKYFDTLSSFTYLLEAVANMILSSRTVNIESRGLYVLFTRITITDNDMNYAESPQRWSKF